MKKQSVREISETKETGRISSTFDDWIANKVVERQAQPEKSQNNQIQIVEVTKDAIMIQP